MPARQSRGSDQLGKFPRLVGASLRAAHQMTFALLPSGVEACGGSLRVVAQRPRCSYRFLARALRGGAEPYRDTVSAGLKGQDFGGFAFEPDSKCWIAAPQRQLLSFSGQGKSRPRGSRLNVAAEHGLEFSGIFRFMPKAYSGCPELVSRFADHAQHEGDCQF